MPGIADHCKKRFAQTDLFPLFVQFRDIWPNLAPGTSQGRLWSRAKWSCIRAAVVQDSQMQVCARLCRGLYAANFSCDLGVVEEQGAQAVHHIKLNPLPLTRETCRRRKHPNLN